MYKRFSLIFLVTATILIVPMFLNLLVSVRSLELLSIDEAVELQHEIDALYGPAFFQNTFLYKVRLVERNDPEIIVMGSSRVMQFRERSFAAPFINCGGGSNDIGEVLVFLKRIVPGHKPKQVLLGLDYWWFNPHMTLPTYEYHDILGDEITSRKLIDPLALVLRGKVSPALYAKTLLFGVGPSQYTGHPPIGYLAMFDSSGFRTDGSRFCGRMLYDVRYSHDVRFEATVERIMEGESRFVHAENMDQDKFAILREIVDYCRDHGVQLYLFMPPMASQCLEAMASSGGYGYVDQVVETVRELGVPFANYTDSRSIGVLDCEYLDGFHPGDVAVERMLLDMAVRFPALSSSVDVPWVRESIAQDAGKALVVLDEEEDFLREIDFLDLGCGKR